MSAGISSLKQTLARVRQATAQPANPERCELCGVGLAKDHRHLVEVATQKLVCACEACGVLFSGQAATRYRRVPLRILRLDDFQLTDAQWDSLLIPINLAFFYQSTPQDRPVAIYPSPGGAMESLLDLASWSELIVVNPVLKAMEPDVEALLVNRISQNSPRAEVEATTGPRYFLVPIDVCYQLVGLIRKNWRGLSGGREVWREIERFFDELAGKSQASRSAG
jgi:hypothetical protein